MGKALIDLFKTKQLADGQTAAEKYEIRNSKDIELRSSTGAMNLPFKGAQILRRNLSSRTRETRLEQEVTGVRIISKLAGPIIYGTDIFKLSTQKTEMVSVMKDSVNPNNSSDSGLLGNAFEKGKEKGLELLNKIGVQLPQKLIPTRIFLNKEFKAGKEPDTMVTLAKIKGDGAGNLAGKFLAQNAKGTPKQIGNQVLGGGINLLKGEVKKKLFGAPKQGAQNLAKKGENDVQYDSTARYSDTINPIDEDYFKRNDLSSILVAQGTKENADPAVKKRVDELVPKGKSINTSKNPFAKLGEKIGDIKKEGEQKLSQAKKVGQQGLASGKKVGDTKEGGSSTSADSIIRYSDTVDETQDDVKLRNDLSTVLKSKQQKETENPDKKKQIDAIKGNVGALNIKENPFAKSSDKVKLAGEESTSGLQSGRKLGQQSIAAGKKIGERADTAEGKIVYSNTVDETQDDVKLRNDLSTKLQALIQASSAVTSAGGTISGLSRSDVTKNMYSTQKNKSTKIGRKDVPSVSLKTKYGIESSDKLDFLNEKTIYTTDPLQLSDGTLLDDHDFIILKFKSIATGETVNFRATVSGISETVSPSWDSAKFIGSPFNYYTYSSVERSVSFNFKLYSTTPRQHIACWQRLNFLTGLAYPQGYSGPYATPPFVELTLGNLYKRKATYIESLSYTMDDNGGWEIGNTLGLLSEKVKINGKDVSMKDYKLPMVVDVSITLKILESKGTTDGGKFYGFSRLGANNSVQPIENKTNTSTNAQRSGDANISANSTKVESSETIKQSNVKSLNNKETNKQTDDNKSSITSLVKKDTGPQFDAFGNVTNEGKFPRKFSKGPQFDAFGNITNDGEF